MSATKDLRRVRRVLIVSPYFPPSSLAGVHRARLISRHLLTFGWEPVVFCVHERHHEEPLDPELATLLAPDLRIVKCGALPSSLLRRLGIGDIGLRGYWHLRHALHGFLERERADVVMFTGSPFYPMLLARGMRARFGIPVVLDFQDPWVTPSGANARALSKRGVSHALAEWLEPRALRSADHVIAVSQPQLEELAARHPWLRHTPMTAIPIGGDPRDFEARRAAPARSTTQLLDPGRVNFSYVGTYWDRAEPVFRVLLLALAELIRRRPDLGDRIRFNFVGTSGQPGGHGRHRLSAMAAATGTAGLVHEVPERIPYLQAIDAMAKSDVLLLLGSDEPHFTASKIYPALLSGRPSLAVYHASSSACDVLTRAGGARLVRFGSVGDLGEKVGEIAEAIRGLAERDAVVPDLRLDAVGEYCADRIAGRFAAIFDVLAAGRA